MKIREKGNGLILGMTMLVMVITFSGCASMVPQWILHPFGTPVTKEAKVDSKIATSTAAVLGSVQGDIHKANDAIKAAEAGNPKGLTEAAAYDTQAQELIDQTQGAPTTASDELWQAEVDGLVSENKAIRDAAVAQQAHDSETIASQSSTLGKLTAEKTAIEAKVTDFAAKNEGLADDVRVGRWVIGGILLLWVAAQILKLWGEFNPAAAVASTVANGILAPAATAAEASAKAGLAAVGTAVGQLRVALPEAASTIISTLDANLDAKHQAIVGKAANATVGSTLGAPSVPKPS